MRRRVMILLGILAAVITASAPCQAMTVDEIVAKANLAAYYAGDTGMADVAMTITDSQGRVRNREFRILRYDVQEGGEQKFYVYFNKPADVAKMVFMVWKHPGTDDDRWLYLPALDLVRRIAASDKRSSFVGSHFVYEDVSGRSIAEDTHELVEETGTAYVLRNVPKDPQGVEFASYNVWIDKSNFLPVRAEYYNGSGEIIRTVEALEVREIQGYPTVIKSAAKDLARGGETVNTFSNIQYDVGLTEDIFQERYLRRAPVQWIR